MLRVFPLLLSAAQRADRPLEWQLAALGAFSVWLFRAKQSSHSSTIFRNLPNDKWEEAISLIWTRWSSAPNASSIQKVLKEIFAKALLFERLAADNALHRQLQLLEKVCSPLLETMDVKVWCYLLEYLVNYVPRGAHVLLECMPQFIPEMLSRMRNARVAPTLGRCLNTVLRELKNELARLISEQDVVNKIGGLH
jgi:hypothetical protein